MIKNIEELLSQLVAVEKKIQDEYPINHAPTIGKMYEGLTSKIISKTASFFPELNLNVVSGFIIDDKNNSKSKQIDCMLVTGTTELIPNTSDYVVHINQVIAIFEVKKELTKSDLEDALALFQNIDNYLPSKDTPSNLFLDSFKAIIKELPPENKKYDGYTPFEIMMSHVLTIEAVTPLKIIIGYNGHKTEKGLRDAFLSIIEENIDHKGYSPTALPSLIISGQNTLIKLNGMPFSSGEYSPGTWDLIASNNSNPLHYILEVIFTRLTYYFNLPPEVFGDDLEGEQCAPLIKANFDHNLNGWHYNGIDLSKKALTKLTPSKSWAPVPLSKFEWIFINMLNKNPNMRTYDKNFESMLAEYNLDKDQFIFNLKKTGLITTTKTKFTYLTKELTTVILPSGTYAGDASDPRFKNWLCEEQAKLKKP
nr:hypothetical protein BHI3_08750 [Bacteriovorax sp. HI3]